MHFQFDGNQAYQLRAIEAVAGLFRGQPRLTIDYGTFAFGELFSPLANRLDLDESQLLDNLRTVQNRNALPPDEKLELIAETVRTASGEQSDTSSMHSRWTTRLSRTPVNYLDSTRAPSSSARPARGQVGKGIHLVYG